MKNLRVVIISLVIAFFVLLICALPNILNRRNMPKPQADIPFPSTFNGDSTGLRSTEIVPTLDTTIPSGKNAIWCASFLAAWKALQDNLTKGPVLLDGNPQMLGDLNAAVDPRPVIPSSTIYTAVGWNKNGLLNKIQSDLKRKFPEKYLPTFPGISQDSFVVYSYVQANVKFLIPYNQNKEKLDFRDSVGDKTKINSFGIPKEDSYTYLKLRHQPCILFRGNEIVDSLDSTRMAFDEFAVDLCSNSSPNQIVVAKIPRQPDLATAVDYVENKIATWKLQLYAESPHEANLRQSILENDTLWACFKISET